jgi:hypothetical protein
MVDSVAVLLATRLCFDLLVVPFVILASGLVLFSDCLFVVCGVVLFCHFLAFTEGNDFKHGLLRGIKIQPIHLVYSFLWDAVDHYANQLVLR